MPHEPKEFVLVDPRSTDGDPFDVAGAAVEQVRALVALAVEQAEIAEKMVLNAELERQCLLEQELDAPGWPQSAAGKRWRTLRDSLALAERQLGILYQAATFNPREKV